MSPFLLLVRVSSNREKRRATHRNSPRRKLISRVRLSLESLEDRTLLTAHWLGNLAGPDGLQALIAPAIGPDGTAGVVWDGGVHHAVAGQWVAGFTGVRGTADEQVRSIQHELDSLVPTDLGATVVRQLGIDGHVLIQVSTNIPENQVKAIADLANVAFVEPNSSEGSVSVIPNDPDFSKLYGMRNTGQVVQGVTGVAGADISATSAWDLTTGSYQIVVADLDTGMDYTHPDLRNNVWLNNAEIPASRLQNLRRYVSNPGNPDDTTKPVTFADLNDSRNWGSFKITPHNDGAGHMVVDANDVLANMDRDGTGADLGTGGWAFPGNTQDGDTAHANDYVGWNFINNTNRPLDDNSHGTHTAGTIGAEGNNSTGVVGVNWVTQIMPVKWLNAGGSGTDAGASQAINYAVQHGAKVSSNSWRFFGIFQSVYDAIQSAGQAGHLFVAAAGNENQNNDTANESPPSFTRATSAGPALDNIIAVAATDNRDQKAGFSSYGPHTVHLGAPGVDVWSTFPVSQGSYHYDSGTSMATPHVAGAATLLWGYRPTATYLDIKSAIVNGVDPIASLNGLTITGGRLNVFNSLQLVAPPAGPSVVSQTPRGDNFATVSSLRLGFDQPINAESFMLDQIVSFTRTLGPDATGHFTVTNLLADPNLRIAPVSGSDRQFDIFFTPQSALGAYSMVIGPNIQDTFGNAMDQDHNGTPGEFGVAPDGDQYAANFNLVGPKIIAQSVTANNNLPGTISGLQVTFNEPMDPTTFTPSKILGFTGPSGSIPITGVTEVAASNHTRFNITFAQLTVTGSYTMLIGPDIRDPAGHQMDQNGNFIPGELPGDIYVAQFGIAGLQVDSSTPTGNNNFPNTVSSVRVNFNEAVNPATFVASQASLTGPNGPAPVPITAITPVAGTSNRSFTLSFASLVATGAYHLVVGPNIQDTFGNKMDQNGNLIPGEPGVPPAGDQYAADFGIVGPRIISPTTTINFSGPAFSVRVTFNEGMDVSTFTPFKIVNFTGPNGVVFPVQSVLPVGSGPLYTQFDIMFAPQTGTGAYTMVIGPDIRDVFGNAMDQNGNLIPGEVPADRFTLNFTIPGPQITSPSALGNFVAGLSQARVTFNTPMNPATFTPAKVASFLDPMGSPVAVTGVTVVPFTDNTQFDITFAPAGRVGTYTMVIGPDIRDLYGNPMDQNGNLIPGEPGVAPAGDQFRLTFNITGPMVVSTSPSGFQRPPVDHVRVTFNEAMNPGSFTVDKVTFSGPGGPIDVAAVQPVAGSTNTQFDVSFDTQTTLGAYTMVLGPGIMDTFGNSAPPFTARFTLANEVVQNGGFETGSFGPEWSTGGGAPTPVISTAQVHSGTYSALLGTVNGPEPRGDSFIKQTIAVPDGHPMLSFWYYPDSTDSIAFDWQEAQIQSTGGATLAQIFRAVDRFRTWTQRTFDLTPFAGQMVVLYFNVHQDGAGDPTSMYLDDVSVMSSPGGGGGGAGAGGSQGGGGGSSAGSGAPAGAPAVAHPAAPLGIAGPSVISQTPSGDNFGVISTLRVGFDEPIRSESFTRDQIVSFTRTAGGIVTDLLPTLFDGITVTPVSSANREFNISFATQSGLGTYTMVIGPNILDVSGRPMDQNHNGIPGEDGVAPAGDQYAATLNIVGPKIIAQSVTGNNNMPGTVNSLQVTFNESTNPLTFIASKIQSFDGPNGLSIPIAGVSAVSGSSNTRFNITFAPLTATGHYTMVIGPDIQDIFGNPMDQDGDFIPDEPSDAYSAQFGVAGLSVLSSTPTGNTTLPSASNSIQVTFSEAVNLATFSVSQASLMGPGGVPVPITAITPVAGSSNTRFTLSAPLVITGNYHLVLGPNIQDTFGNQMDQNGNLIPGEPGVAPAGDQYAADFGIAGLKVTSSTPTGNNNSPSATSFLQVTFNEPVNPTTFTASRASLTVSGVSVPITAVTPVAGSNNTRFNLSPPLVVTGNYHLVLSENIQDMFGNKMDQNGNLIPGEPGVPPAGDQYEANFGVTGPRVISPTTTINFSGPLFSVRVGFNESMDVSTFTPSKIASFTGPNGAVIPVLGVFPVAGTSTSQFDIVFMTQAATGAYTMVIGPNIRDLFGNQMDQDQDLMPGQVPQDQFTLRFTVPGPRINSSTSLGNQVAGFSQVRVTFNVPMNPATFTPAKIASFLDPMMNPVAVTGVTVAPFTDNTQFDIRFAPAGRAGTYTMVIGPDIRDLYGNQMDQNQNFIPGEVPGDQFRLTFNIIGPMVVSASPSGFQRPPLDHVRLTYNEPMNPDTFTVDLVTFTGPDGPIDVADVQPVAMSNNTQFDITFDAQATLGAYTMVIAAGVMDFFNNSAPAFTDHFALANIINVLYVGGHDTSWKDSSVMNFTQISVSQFATQSLAGFDEIWVDETVNGGDPNLQSRRADIAAFVNAGGGLITDCATSGNYSWVPNAADLTWFAPSGNDVRLTALGQTHPVTVGLTDAGLSNWGQSWHTYFSATGGMDILATSSNTSQALILTGSFGSGRLVYFGLDPTYHWTQVGIPQAVQLMRQAVLWAGGGGVSPRPVPPSPLGSSSGAQGGMPFSGGGSAPALPGLGENRAAAPFSGGGSALALPGGLGANLFAVAFASIGQPSFAGGDTAGAESVQPPFSHNDLLTSPNPGDRWRAVSSTRGGRVQTLGSDEFDPFMDPNGGDLWWWV